jgi:hypothetical protein
MQVSLPLNVMAPSVAVESVDGPMSRAIPWIGESLTPDDLVSFSRRIVCVAQ